jgi:crotonobetainyl-CoA:carnitine CoA-transferase CaiB-like acyl-CoA transferase
VLELGHGVAGPFAARILADHGAHVVKVEPPEGDLARRLAPVGVLFEYLNWNKRGVIADLRTGPGRRRVSRLIDDADIVLTSFRPGRLSEWGIDLDEAVRRRPELVVASVTNFGATGPDANVRATDLILQAVGGVMQITGVADREPLKPGLRQSLYCAGLNVAYVAIAAYLGRLRGGAGATVDVSIAESLASSLVVNEAHVAFAGVVQGRRPEAQDPLSGEPLPCADGWVSIQTSGLVGMGQIAGLFGDQRLADARFSSTEGRTQAAAELTAILAEHLRDVRGRDFFITASERGLLTGFVQDAGDLLACPQLQAREVWHEHDGVRYPAELASLSLTPTSVRSPAPRLGEHDRRPWPSTARVPEPLAPARHNPAGPLAGLRVLDLSTVFAVPYLGGLLADLGADVIKIEAPHRLDQTRTFFGLYYDNDPGTEWWNRSGLFDVVNRGKRSLTLDLSQPAGRDILLRLVRDADVLLDNFTPRVMRAWGTTYDQLREINPSLVMLSNTGYGSSGPWSALRAQGTTLEATMGLTAYTGYIGGRPMKGGQSYPDFLACWSGLTALLAALVHRQASGAGQWIDLGMYQLGAAVVPEALLAHQLGREILRVGNRDLDADFSGVFATRSGWMALSSPDAATTARLATALGGADDDAVAAWSADRDRAEAIAIVRATGVAAGPVNDAADLLDDPQLRARGFYEYVWCGNAPRPLIGRPYRWQDPHNTAVGVRGPGPAMGGANTGILTGVLGLTPAELDRLAAAQVISDSPVGQVPVPPAINVAALREVGLLTRTGVRATPDRGGRRARQGARGQPRLLGNGTARAEAGEGYS